MNLFDRYGQISLDQIRDEDLDALAPDARAAIDILIVTVIAKTKAEQRKLAAVRAVHACMAAEDTALAAHLAVSPAPSQQEAHAASVAAYIASHP